MKRITKTWTNVWIPVVPSEEGNQAAKAPLRPTNVKALFFSTKIRNETELRSRLNEPRTALVTNRILSLDTEIRDLLQKSYPDTDFNKCLIIQEGRTPFSREVVYMLGAGAGWALLSLGVFLAAWRSKRLSPSRASDQDH